MRILCFAALCMMGGTSLSQDAKSINSEISEVTVYPQGALVSRTGRVDLVSGRQFVKFVGLASELQQATIGVSAQNGIDLLSVSFQVNHLNKGLRPKYIKSLEDSLKALQFDHLFNKNMLDVYSQERSMILANKSVGWGGDNSDFIIEDLEDLSDFYRNRLADIMLKEMQLNQQQEKLNKSIQRIQNQLREDNVKFNKANGEVLVELYSKSQTNAELGVTYMVGSAGWSPNYNVTVSEIDAPMELAYNAKVYQNTGVAWKDVRLILTNANPNQSGDKPILHPWRLYFLDNFKGAMDYSNKMEVGAVEIKSLTSAEREESAPVLGATIDYPMNDAITQYKLNDKYSIPSNWKKQSIKLRGITINAEYEYYSAPKIDPSAFLIAKIADFEQYDLLPGQANLFLLNTYVGKTFLNPKSVNDTLELSLGRDESVIVKREKILEYGENKKIGSTTKEQVGHLITIKNTKRTTIKITFEDQVPVSTNKDITVNLDEAKGARHLESTGKLTWTKNILAGEADDTRIKYSIKYPSDKKINF